MEVNSMERNERDKEIKRLTQVVWSAPIQDVLSKFQLVKGYPMYLTKVKLYNAIKARKHA